MAATIIIDAVDGSLARIFRIKERLPEIDGSLLDNIVDYFTWTIVPFVWGIQVMHISLVVAAICVTAALFGFSNVKAKTADHFFTGFPNYWNLVLFHLYALHVPAVFIRNHPVGRCRFNIYPIKMDLSITNPLSPKNDVGTFIHLCHTINSHALVI